MAYFAAANPADMGEAMANMTGMEVGEMDKLGMADMAMQTGLTPGMVASMGAAGISGMDVSTIMSTNVAGLGSKAIQGVAQMAKAGKMSQAGPEQILKNNSKKNKLRNLFMGFLIK